MSEQPQAGRPDAPSGGREGNPIESARVVQRIGSDHVTREGKRLLITTHAPMEDWAIRPYHRHRITFEGTPYALVDKRTEGSQVRYVLEPWDDPNEPPAKEWTYDEAYVNDRDARRKKDVTAAGVRPLVSALNPLIGFLPSPVKRRLDVRNGICARHATLCSLAIEGMSALLLVGFLTVLMFVNAFCTAAKHVGLQIDYLTPAIALVLLSADAFIRFDRWLRDDPYPPGFYEWPVVWCIRLARWARRR